MAGIRTRHLAAHPVMPLLVNFYFCGVTEASWMVENETSYWESVSGSWDGRRQRLWRRHSDAANRALVNRWLPSGRADCVLKTDLFDEMCGDGLIPILASRAGRVVGVDISHCAMTRARGRNPALRGVVADVVSLPFAGESFDYILSNSTLDHFGSLGEIRGSLAELFRVLRRGGEMTITMDNPTNPIIAVRNRLPFRLLNRLGITPYYVGMTCGARQLRRLLEEAGFQVLETSSVMHCPRVLAVPLASLLDRYASAGMQRLFLRVLLSFERLRLMPTHALTGHFVAARVTKQRNGALAPAHQGGAGNVA